MCTVAVITGLAGRGPRPLLPGTFPAAGSSKAEGTSPEEARASDPRAGDHSLARRGYGTRANLCMHLACALEIREKGTRSKSDRVGALLKPPGLCSPGPQGRDSRQSQGAALPGWLPGAPAPPHLVGSPPGEAGAHSDGAGGAGGPGGGSGAGLSCGQSSRHVGGGRGVRESQEDMQDRSQGGSVVPDGVLQGLRGESPGLDLVQPCFP